MAILVSKRTLFLLAIQLVGTWSLFTRKALYTDNDHIALLNVSTFKPTLYDTSNAWIVEFYNSWCGHCIRFAPEWIKLAFDVKEWRNVIRVAAIDCAVEENVPLCQQYAVTAFPTIKFFPPYSTEKEIGTTYDGSKAITDIRNAMVDFVSSSNQKTPSSWPDLQPIRYLDMNSLWQATSPNVSHAAIIVELPNSHLGREVILDTLHLTTHIRVVRATSESPVIENFKGVIRPFLIVISRDGYLKINTESSKARTDYIKYLEEFAQHNLHWTVKGLNDEAADDNNKLTLDKEQGENEKQDFINMSAIHGDKVYLQDLENVLHYTFWREIPLQKNITGEKLIALRSFLTLLTKYLHGRPETKKLLSHLEIWLNEQGSFITGDQLRDKLEDLQKSQDFKLEMRDWIACKGSLPYLRGYPCGLWVTFHTLTVSAYIQNQEDLKSNPLQVLLSIRGYVRNFFSCRTCVEHFSNMSASLEFEVKTVEKSVLWLWEAHNKANMRLKGDETEDPTHPKVQFPADILCPNCRVTVNGNSQWNQTAVLQFLLGHYSPEGILTTTDDAKSGKAMNLQVSHRPISQVNSDYKTADNIRKRDVRIYELAAENFGKSNSATMSFPKWVFGNVDISLCILLYISSIMLLLICYFYILTRHKHLVRSFKRKVLHLIS